jgi:hypothetical protein
VDHCTHLDLLAPRPANPNSNMAACKLLTGLSKTWQTWIRYTYSLVARCRRDKIGLWLSRMAITSNWRWVNAGCGERAENAAAVMSNSSDHVRMPTLNWSAVVPDGSQTSLSYV